MKMIAISRPQVHDTDDIEKVIGSNVKVRGHVNAIAPKPLKGYEPELTQTFPINYVFKVTDSKI